MEPRNDMLLTPQMKKALQLGSSGLDVMHGQIKVLMLEAEDQLLMAQEKEEETDYDDAMDSMERKYWEGQVDALAYLYSLTYQLSFAIAEMDQLTLEPDNGNIDTNQLQKGNKMNHEHYWDTPSNSNLVAECACGDTLEAVTE